MSRFRDALAGAGLAAIAEVKRRSPSAGDLRPDADPRRWRPRSSAREPRRSRSSSTSASRLGRRPRAQREAAARCRCSRRGSSASADELDELKRRGADAVLLLLRDLDDGTPRGCMARAAELGLDTLVEAHDADELARAVEPRRRP